MANQDIFNHLYLFNNFSFLLIDDVAAPYLRTSLITDNFYHLSQLEIGSRYTIILVATTGTEDINLETESDRVILKTGGQPLHSRNVAAEPWFIGLMVSIALLIILLINVCVLVRERGAKYSGKYDFIIEEKCLITMSNYAII